MEPTTAASSLDGCKGFIRAGFTFLPDDPFFSALAALAGARLAAAAFGAGALFAAAGLALAELVHAGDTREAERVAHEARAASADNDLLNFIVTDRVLAHIHVHRREHTAAGVDHAHSAVVDTLRLPEPPPAGAA